MKVSRQAIKNERGVALVLALVMLVLLSILGAVSLNTSSTELIITGNFRNAQGAFFAADGAAENAQVDQNIYAAIVTNLTVPAHVWPQAGGGNSPVDADFNDITVGTSTARVQVRYAKCGTRPAGSGNQQNNPMGQDTLQGNGNFFIINAVGQGQNTAEIAVEAMVARAIPGSCE